MITEAFPLFYAPEEEVMPIKTKDTQERLVGKMKNPAILVLLKPFAGVYFLHEFNYY